MVSRQIGHFYFEPKGYDEVNLATHEHKEAIKVGYNLRRKVVLLAIWAVSPLPGEAARLRIRVAVALCRAAGRKWAARPSEAVRDDISQNTALDRSVRQRGTRPPPAFLLLARAAATNRSATASKSASV